MTMSTGAWGRASETELVPTTFERLGYRLGFTMPALADARVRRGSDGRLEVLTDALSGGGGIHYVLAWSSLPAVMRLGHSDRRLYTAVTRSAARHPLQFRAAVERSTAPDGRGAQADAAAGRVRQTATLEWLVQQLLVRLGGSDRQAEPGAGLLDLGEPDVQQRLSRFSRTAGIPSARVVGCLAELAELLAPLGPDLTGREGVLRSIWRQLHQLRLHAAALGSDTAGPLLARTIDVTLQECAAPMALIDRAVADLPAVLTGWDSHLPDLEQAVERLSWLLLGWDQVVASMRGSGWLGSPRLTGFGAARLLPMLPLVSARRGIAAEKPFAAARDPGRRRVGQAEDWRTGIVDAELRTRLLRSTARRSGSAQGIREPRAMLV